MSCMPGPYAQPPPPFAQSAIEATGLAHEAHVRGEAQRLLAQTAELAALPAHDLCHVRYLYYRGDENYGLGNVLYDVASAAALALAFNRTLLYGADRDDRKFGTLLEWPGILTMADAEAMRERARCGSGSLAQRRVVLAPDRCTYTRTWRKERAGHVRCLRRLLGINWVAERSPVLELSKARRIAHSLRMPFAHIEI
jgi:hypothetical protein